MNNNEKQFSRTRSSVKVSSYHLKSVLGIILFSGLLAHGDIATQPLQTIECGDIQALAISPDGSKFVTCGWSGVFLWELPTGKYVRSFEGHTWPIYSVAISPDGKRVLTGSMDETARLWELATGKLLRTFSHSNSVDAVAISPDGSLILTAVNETAILWNASTGNRIRTLTGHLSGVKCVAFSPDGQFVLTGSYDNTAKLWATSSGSFIRTFVGHTSFINSVAFSPNGANVLTASSDGGWLWDTTTGLLVRKFQDSSMNYPNFAMFSPNGERVLCGSGGGWLWATSGLLLRQFGGNTFYTVVSAGFLPGGQQVLLGSDDSKARLWDLSDLIPQLQVQPSAGANGSISPNTLQTVNSGASVSFTASPNATYAVDQWLVDGSVVQTGGIGYMLSNIQANRSVQVTFHYVGKAEATVTLGGLSHTYDGTVKNATATTVPAGLTVNITYNGLPNAPISVGNYTVIATINDPYNQGSATGTLVISPLVPTPVITTLEPSQVKPGSAAFFLYVNGANFVTNTVIRWNGVDQVTKYVSTNRLRATIEDTLIDAPGTVSITVVNRGVGGDVTSSEAILTIGDAATTSIMTLGRTNNIITICWPTNGFKLQSTPVLPATNWQDVAGSEISNYFRVTNATGNLFYRALIPPPYTNAPTGMVYIPAGSFTIGDIMNDTVGNLELPTHTVQVSTFYMDMYEVTKDLWDRVFNWATVHGYSIDNAGLGKGPNHPVHSVNWYDVVKWCNARSEKEGRVPAYYTDMAQTTVYRTGQVNLENGWVKWNAGYRLPTEAEWEKAARGGISGHRFPWSNVNTITHSQANYYSRSYLTYDISSTRDYNPSYDNNPQPYTSPVGSFVPNEYGLYDMAGNLCEWCWDRFGFYSSDSQNDPRGPTSDLSHVCRGGSWNNEAYACRVAARLLGWPNDIYDNIGFRTVLALGQ